MNRRVTALAAKAVVRKTEASKSLTPREKDFAAGIITGDANPNSVLMDSPLVQEAIIESLHSLGIDKDYVANHIKGGLEADKLYGKDAISHADWTARHKYLVTLLELAKIRQKEQSPRLGAVHIHYKSNVSGQAKVIDVNPPSDDKAHRRLLAARPTNRRGI